MGILQLQIGQCLLYVLIVYSVLVYFISSSFNSSLQKEDLPKLTEKQENIVSDISLVQNNYNCPQEFQPLFSYNWSGLNEGFYCKNKKTIYRKNEKNLKSQSCQLLQQVNQQTINSFGLQISQESEIAAFKLCGKVVKNFEMVKVDQFINKQIVGVIKKENNLSIQENQEDIIQNNAQKQYRIAISLDSNKQQLDQKSCQEGKKECVYYKIFCVDQHELCPISNISIQKREIQSNLQNKDVIHINQEYEIVIQRESSDKLPLVDFVISQEEGVCKNNKNQVYNQYYLLDKRTKCDQIDTTFKSISQFTLSSKQLYSINKIDLKDHKDLISEEEKYNLFIKELNLNSDECISEEEYDNIKSMYSDLKDQSPYIDNFTLFIAFLLILLCLCKKYPQFIESYIDPLKTETYILYLSLFIYFITLWMITSIQIKFGEVKDQIVIFQQRDCLNKSIATLIRKYLRNSLDIKLGFLLGLLYIPLIVYIGVMFVKRFCWMKRYPVHVIPPKKQKLIELKSNSPQRRTFKK